MAGMRLAVDVINRRGDVKLFFFIEMAVWWTKAALAILRSGAFRPRRRNRVKVSRTMDENEDEEDFGLLRYV